MDVNVDDQKLGISGSCALALTNGFLPLGAPEGLLTCRVHVGVSYLTILGRLVLSTLHCDSHCQLPSKGSYLRVPYPHAISRYCTSSNVGCLMHADHPCHALHLLPQARSNGCASLYAYSVYIHQLSRSRELNHRSIIH